MSVLVVLASVLGAMVFLGFAAIYETVRAIWFPSDDPAYPPPSIGLGLAGFMVMLVGIVGLALVLPL